MKPSRSRSNGREALVGLVVVGREGGQQVEAGDAERVDHAVRAAGEHHVGVAAADDLGRLADGLAAGGAGGQAVGVRALRVEHAWPGRPAGMFGSCSSSTVGWSRLEAFLVNAARSSSPFLQRGDHHVAEVGKSCWPSPPPR